MTRNMFDDVVEPSVTVGSSRRYTVPLSIAAHTLAIAALVIVPLAAMGALPSPRRLMPPITIVHPAPPPLPPPPSARPPSEVRSTAIADPSVAPIEAPAAVTPEPDVVPRTGLVGVIELGARDG